MTTPDEPLKSCGTCKWWRAWRHGTDFGDCICPVPYAVMVEGRESVKTHDGSDCETWNRLTEMEES